jgi:hypothetical protein
MGRFGSLKEAMVNEISKLVAWLIVYEYFYL